MLADFFDGLKTAVAARGFAGPVQLGARYLAGQTSPLAGRVVCVLGREAVQPTTRVGGSPRSRLTRMGALSVHCWGPMIVDAGGAMKDVDSLRSAEALVSAVCNAARDVATGTIQITSVDWTPSEETPIAKAGYLAIVEMAVEIPIVDVTWPTAPGGAHAPVPHAWNHYTPPAGSGHAITGPACGEAP